MRIGILGTGAFARGLAIAWGRAGHKVTVGGRSPAKAEALAEDAGYGVRAGDLRTAATGRDAVLLAVTWAGIDEALEAAGAGDGTLAGVPLIDPTNAVDPGAGALLTEPAPSAAQHIAGRCPGAHVVKALHLFPAQRWSHPPGGGAPVTVPLCGDDPDALRTVESLVRDLGATPVVLGGLDRARQSEEAAGFVMGLAFAGADPNAAVPSVG